MNKEDTENTTGELPKLSAKHEEFVDNLFFPEVSFNQTEAYVRTYPAVKSRLTARRLASRLMTNEDIRAHIKARFDERRMSIDEVTTILEDQARARLGDFFKPIDEWMFFPLPTYEILDTKEVEDTSVTPPKTRIMYRVRHLVLDIDKVIDPRYAHLIREFQDKGKDGMTIKLGDQQAAIDKILRVQGAYRDKVALTGADGGPVLVETMKPSEIAAQVAALLQATKGPNGSDGD